MATLFAGERLLDVDHLTGSGASTYYTVPAGRWAKIRIYSVAFSGTSTGGNFIVGSFGFDSTTYNASPTFGQTSRYNVSGSAIDPGSSQTAYNNPPLVEIVLKSGQTVAGTNAGITAVFSVQEFANP